MRCQKHLLWSVASILMAATISGLAAAQNSKEVDGRAAEQAGRLREALTHYVAALQSASEGSADDHRLRETIIKLVQRLSPPPAIPEDARRFSVRGETWMKDGRSAADFEEAVKEFAKAMRVAPWWADAWVALSAVHEQLGNFASAVSDLENYLRAALRAPDRDEVQNKIYELQYRGQRGAK